MNSYFVTIGGKEHIVSFSADKTVLLDGKRVDCLVERLGDNTFSILLDGRSLKVVTGKNENDYHVLLRGKQFDVAVESERTRLLKQFESKAATLHARREIRAPMPALVVRVEVEAGEVVRAGQGVVILEAMKMENEIKVPGEGTVKEIRVRKGDTVEKGELLIVLE